MKTFRHDVGGDRKSRKECKSNSPGGWDIVQVAVPWCVTVGNVRNGLKTASGDLGVMWSRSMNSALIFPVLTDVFAFTVDVMYGTPAIACWSTTVFVGMV